MLQNHIRIAGLNNEFETTHLYLIICLREAPSYFFPDCQLSQVQLRAKLTLIYLFLAIFFDV